VDEHDERQVDGKRTDDLVADREADEARVDDEV
jgi:hypothetical protein